MYVIRALMITNEMDADCAKHYVAVWEYVMNIAKTWAAVVPNSDNKIILLVTSNETRAEKNMDREEVFKVMRKTPYGCFRNEHGEK